MLTEHFIASVGVPTKAPGANVARDVAIVVHEFQPLCAQRAVFKKSATPPNCLAVSESHIFAAQAEKAVIHVYNREKRNQEAIVPFTERITCLTLACGDGILILGTAEGRIFLWETFSGRQVTTAQAHLQTVTALVVDPTSNFLLSASADSTVHVWSIPSLLSFTNAGSKALSPLTTFTSHRAEIAALAVGHSSSFCNIAISASKDKTCLVWDYFTNSSLRTYLLPAVPTCIDIDAADRAAYVGYEDGSVQLLDLLASTSSQSRHFEAVQNGRDASAPIQPPASSMMKTADRSNGAVLSITISYDGCTVLTGHESGTVLSWDVARGAFQNNILQNPLPSPVTNLNFLPVSGFSDTLKPKMRIPAVVKPKFGAFDSSHGFVPGNYALNVDFQSNISNPVGSQAAFQRELLAPSFSTEVTDEGLSELATWGRQPATPNEMDAQGSTEEFITLGDHSAKPRRLTLEEQNAALRGQLEALRRLQTASFDKLERINGERKALLEREQKRLAKSHRPKRNHDIKANGLSYQEQEDEEELDDFSDD